MHGSTQTLNFVLHRAAAPKRAKIERASRDLREHQAELADLQTKLSHLQVQLNKQKEEYEMRVQERDALSLQVSKTLHQKYTSVLIV